MALLAPLYPSPRIIPFTYHVRIAPPVLVTRNLHRGTDHRSLGVNSPSSWLRPRPTVRLTCCPAVISPSVLDQPYPYYMRDPRYRSSTQALQQQCYAICLLKLLAYPTGKIPRSPFRARSRCRYRRRGNGTVDQWGLGWCWQLQKRRKGIHDSNMRTSIMQS